MSKVTIRKGMYELTEKPIDSSLWNKDLDPTTIDRRNWHKWNIIALWVGLSVCIPTYMLGSSLIGNGMNWWQAVITVLLGNLVVLIPLILIGHAGTKYGIPFPVFLRPCFGTQGARFASLLRAVVACGWFGIQTWIGGNAIYQLAVLIFPYFAHSFYLGSLIGLNVAQLSCFLLFWIVQMMIIHHGIEIIRKLAVFAAPLLILFGVALIVWAWVSVGSFTKILQASYTLSGTAHASIWKIFWPGLTSIVGFWSTLALNIPDFTRFARSQRDQAIGQFIGLPSTMTLYAFIGIIVTSATVLLFGKAMWDPVILLGQFKSPIVVMVSMFALGLATICCNLTANVVAPANDFTNLLPSKISFRTGCYITGVIGILILPWKLIASSQDYIFEWLLAYSAMLGAVGGIMLCDYYVLRKTKLNLHDLFQVDGEYTFYHGWNISAFIAMILAILPSIPGFLVTVGLIGSKVFPIWLIDLYHYAWFISLGLAFVIYWLLRVVISYVCNK
ncbi:MAG: NCS1 family nucleobase:cation symporter-1 [Gammaproteobacteria bacterium]|jgi:NCS1 family nucleobase:cation symporter-1